MKKRFIAIFSTISLLFALFTPSVHARSFNYNFNNNKTDGWYLGNSRGWPTHLGQWSVVDGVLIQNSGYDGVIGVIEDSNYTNQDIDLDIKPFGVSGGGGVVLWYNDDYNLAYVVLSSGRLEIAEWSNNVCTNVYHSIDYSVNENRWVNLNVTADSNTGEIKAYMDGKYVFSYIVSTQNRSGQTGVISGNAGASFDNFRVKAKIH